jgi:hypothetical protein
VIPTDALAFVCRSPCLAAQGINPRDIVNGDESAFLPYPHGYWIWPRTGSDATQIPMRGGNEKQTYAVVIAGTMDGLKLPFSTIVKSKPVRSEWGLDLDRGGLDAGMHTATGWQTTETMQQRLRFLGSLPECEGMHEIHVTIDRYAAHLCNNVRELADGLGICLHFIPGLTDIMNPLDRALFGALKAEYRAIYRYEMSQREDKSMTKETLLRTCCRHGSWCWRTRPIAVGSATAHLRRCNG